MGNLGSIYIIINNTNNKVYIGQTRNKVSYRFKTHIYYAKKGKDYVIGKAMRKYGIENFYYEIIEKCPSKDLNKREIYWIAQYNSTNPKFGYNVSKGGNKISFRELDEDEVLTLFKLGNSAYIIAKELLHTSVSKVSEILKKNHIKYGIDKQKVQRSIEEEVIDLYKKGYGCRKISAMTSLNKTTVLKVLHRNDIQIRTVKERMNLRGKLLTSKKMSHESSAVDKN